MICNFCEMGVVKDDRCTTCGKRPKSKKSNGASIPPVEEPAPLPTTTPPPIPKDAQDPRLILKQAYDAARVAADEVNEAHAIYLEKRKRAEAAAQRYLAMREAYVAATNTGDVTEDGTLPDGKQPVRCRHCSEPLAIPIPVRCDSCGRLTSDPKERNAARNCPTCGTPNPADREECYACYHKMQT